MRYIDTSLVFISTDSRIRIPIGAFLMHFADDDAAFNADATGWKAARRIELAVKAAFNDDYTPKAKVVRLDDPDWKILCAALEKPRPMRDGLLPYMVHPARRVAALIEGITNAPEVEPVAEEQPATNGVSAQAS